MSQAFRTAIHLSPSSFSRLKTCCCVCSLEVPVARRERNEEKERKRGKEREKRKKEKKERKKEKEGREGGQEGGKKLQSLMYMKLHTILGRHQRRLSGGAGS